MIGIEIEHPVFYKTEEQPLVICGTLGADKNNPIVVPEGTWHEDGVMLEYALAPTETASEQWDNYLALNEVTNAIIPESNLGLCSALLYPHDLLKASPEANEIGCSPSFSVYSEGSVTPSEYLNDYRFAGLHINIDFDGDYYDRQEFVKSLDYYIGLHSVVNWEQEDKENNILRRKAYGQAGNWRDPYFGVEYRTLPSNVWSKENCATIYQLVDTALEKPAPSLDGGLVQEAINTCNKELALSLLE